MEFLCGVLTPLLLMGAGGYFAVTAGGRILRRPRRLLSGFQGGRSGAKAMAVALAGTLGVGNIVGVAAAMAMGGPGAVFWMWVSALLAMFLKYAEVVLAVNTRCYDKAGRPHGGAMFYIKTAVKGKAGKCLAALFALLCLGCAMTLGGVIQSNAAAEALEAMFAVPPWLTGVLMGVAAALILALGAERVENACTALVPFVCLLFTGAAAVVLVLCRARIPAAFAAIFGGAFAPQSAPAGVLGFFGAKAVRYGVTRGLVSNEAGCGTAPIAHAAAETESPARQGLWGMLEVFVDTVLLCTLTALVILVSGVPLGEGSVATVMDAFGSVLGDFAPPVLAVSVLVFAFATLLCWSHYGGECLRYLTGHPQAAKGMIPITLAASVVGAVAAPAPLWTITDLLLALMTLLNVTVLLRSRRTVLAETKAYFCG